MKRIFALLLLSLVPALYAAKKPNIIFIMADDLGWAELGSYGQKKIKTPHLDKLASEGMRFTSNYSGNAVCAPSRCVLMTGKHPGHAFVRNNKAMQPEGQHPIPTSEVTIGELLQNVLKTKKDREATSFKHAIDQLQTAAGSDVTHAEAVSVLSELNQEGVFDDVPFETVWGLILATAKSVN